MNSGMVTCREYLLKVMAFSLPSRQFSSETCALGLALVKEMGEWQAEPVAEALGTAEMQDELNYLKVSCIHVGGVCARGCRMVAAGGLCPRLRVPWTRHLLSMSRKLARVRLTKQRSGCMRVMAPRVKRVCLALMRTSPKEAMLLGTRLAI